ncbi:MAG: hypothetical protein SynsKO_39650 [Synoicihabitans sp.]
MINRQRLTILTGLLTWGIGTAFAQTAASADAEDVVELSPFEVDATADVGYQAQNTLAGSRLNTKLKDVAASITVLTPEFLEDLAADDIETALAYVAGVETNLTTDTSSATGGYLNNSTHTSPGNNRIRGLARADVTADFFSVGNGNLDTYNIERITLVRGPNSVLFGLGSPAGILDYTTKKAQFRNFGSYQNRVDNFGSIRHTIDLNRELIDDKLAVRFMGLMDNGKSQYDRTFDKDERVSTAITFRPWQSGQLRIGYEHAATNARRARYLAPQDNISGWIAAGRPTWNPAAYAGMDPQDVFSDPRQAAAFSTLDGSANNPFAVFTDPNATSPDYASFLANVNGSGQNQSPLAQFYRSADPDEDTWEIDQQVGDSRIFPIQDVDLATLAGSFARRDDEKLMLTFEQRITDALQFEVGYYKDETINDNFNQIFSQNASVQIDVNETLPNGQTNPNFLRPFLYSRGIANYSISTREAFRVTGSYELDFEKINDGLKFLGRHQFAGLYSTLKENRYKYVWEPKISQYGPIYNDDYDLQGSNRRVAQIFYVGDPFLPNQEFPTYTSFPNVGLGLGNPFSLNYYDAAAGNWNSSSTVTANRLVHNPPTDGARSAVEGHGGSLQSFFWGGRIVTTVGWRTDEIASWTTTGPALGPDGLRPINFDDDGWNFALDPDYEAVSGETITKGVVVSPLDWFSVHYNESENFEVAAQKVDVFRRPIASSGGDGKDYGFSLNLLDNRLIAKVNFFETAQVNADTGAFGFTSSWGVQSYERQFYGYLRRNNRLDEWVHPLGDKDENGSGFDANYLKPSNVGDINDFVSEGTEFEVIYNPNRNWRIAFNATQVQTTQANSAVSLVEYQEMRLPYVSQFFDENRNSRQTWGEWWWQRIGKPIANAEAANGKVSTALAEWSANVITNYQFTDGTLKGFGIGGSIRWREGATIGYPDITENGITRSDIDNPFTGPAMTNIGLHASYQRKIMDEKVNWKIQLNISNLIEEDDLIANRINPNGVVASWRIGRDRKVQLTNTFRF